MDTIAASSLYKTSSLPRRPLVYIATAYIAGIAFCYFVAPPFALLSLGLAAAAASAVLSLINALPRVSSSPGFPAPGSPVEHPSFCPDDCASEPKPAAQKSARYGSGPFFALLLCAAFFAGSVSAFAAFDKADPLESQMTDGFGYADGIEGHVLFAEQREIDYQVLTVWADGRKLLVRVYGEKGLPMSPAPEDLVGKRVLLSGQLSYPDTARNPGGFDYRLHLLTKNIRVILTCALPGDFAVAGAAGPAGSAGSAAADSMAVTAAGAAAQRENPLWGALSFLARAKAAFAENVRGVLPPEEAALFMGMMFGDKEELDEETYELFKRHGVAHILSVSGLHVGMVYAFVSTLLGRRKTKKFYIAVLALLLCYAALSNFSPSVMRAFSMIGVHIAAMLLNRRYDMLTGVLFSALIMLIINPLALFGTGFLLSYTAVCSLSFALPFVTRHTGFMNRLSGRSVKENDLQPIYGTGPVFIIAGRVLKLVIPAAIIQLFMLPLTIYFFNCLPLLAVLVNIPVIALATFVVPFGIVVLLLTASAAAVAALAPALGPAAEIGVHSSGFLIDLMLFLTHTADRIPYSSLTVPSPPLPCIIAVYAAAFFLLSDTFAIGIARRAGGIAQKHLQHHCVALPVIIALAVLLVGATPMGKHNDALYTFVDVGQGDCLHIRTADGRNYLADGGGRLEYDVGKNIIAPYLLKNGVSRLDGVFVSHLHMDHFKGLTELAAVMDVGTVYVYDGNRVRPEAVTAGFAGAGAPAEPLTSGDPAGPDAGPDNEEPDVSVQRPAKGAPADPDNEEPDVSVQRPANGAPALSSGGLRYLAAGDVVRLGSRTQAEILFPPRRTDDEYEWIMAESEDENLSSLIIRFESEGLSVLMTGDISKDGERAAIAVSDLSCDILKVAHHGSKTSTSFELLAAAKPSAAVIQVGKNPFGHPTPETLQALDEAGIPVYRNDESGAILISPLKGGFAVRTVKRDFVSPMLLKAYERDGPAARP